MSDRLAWLGLGFFLGMIACALLDVEVIRLPFVSPESRGDQIAAETKGE
jgi:hypothetical protein